MSGSDLRSTTERCSEFRIQPVTESALLYTLDWTIPTDLVIAIQRRSVSRRTFGSGWHYETDLRSVIGMQTGTPIQKQTQTPTQKQTRSRFQY